MRPWFWLTLVCALILPAVSCRLLPHDEPDTPAAPQQSEQRRPAIVFEEPHAPPVRDVVMQPEVPVEKPGVKLPRIAIIIDDMGYHGSIGKDLLALDLNLTFSFLPKAPFTKQQEEEAWTKGRTILLHLPMQAKSKHWDPGPGALYISFSPQQIHSVVLEDLKSIPHAVGCNNHMGSRFTEDRTCMREVLDVLKKRNLFFVDSYTTAASIGLDEARKMGVPTARRHVFLDNEQDAGTICRQLDLLLSMAEKNGQAIGIAHPHRATLQALRRCGPHIHDRVELVGVDALVY
jgi:polysaccharide deacetylase 2 family uncharacterized protein YibQ